MTATTPRPPALATMGRPLGLCRCIAFRSARRCNVAGAHRVPWARRVSLASLRRHHRELHGCHPLGIGDARGADASTGPVCVGVFPSLVAWVALLLPAAQGLVTLALLLGMCLAVDRRSYPAYGLSPWLPMRMHLTLAATFSLLAGSLAV